MKNLVLTTVFLLCFIWACSTTKTAISNPNKTSQLLNDTIRITNEKLEYEVIIIDNGFSTWLHSRSLPRGYHSQSYLEIKNQLYVTEWNFRVNQPQRYNPALYEMTINYDPNIDYGYEVNYLIYNYMIYFQNTYKQKLGGPVPLR